MSPQDIDNRFDHHAPTIARAWEHDLTRCAVKDLARAMNDRLPEGREKALFFTALEEALFWANAAIARS